jgi:hypothetical protein
MPDWIEAISAALAAVIAVVAAAFARRDSRRSADAAERSAATAEDSAGSSAESAAVARREEGRLIERSDVEWRRLVERPERRGHLEFRNVGTTVAHVVTAVVSVNGERIHLECDRVLAGGSSTYDATKLGKTAVIAGSVGGKYVYGTKFDVTARITWQSQLGTPGVWAYDPSSDKSVRA